MQPKSDIQRKRFERRLLKTRGARTRGVDYAGPAGSACETCLAASGWGKMTGWCSVHRQNVFRFQNCSDYTSRKRG